MHESVLTWVEHQAIPAMERHMDRKTLAIERVLEVGSLDVNGSVRPLIEQAFHPERYLGIDVVEGPGVDKVYDITRQPLADEMVDLVVCTETLEHMARWKVGLKRMKRTVRRGGFLLLTTRAPGFPYHHPPDRWRFTVALLSRCMDGWLPLYVGPDRQAEHPGVFGLWYRPKEQVRTIRGKLVGKGDGGTWHHLRAEPVDRTTAPYVPRFLGDHPKPPWAEMGVPEASAGYRRVQGVRLGGGHL